MVKTYAFLDNGSNTTFCTENLVEQLQTRGKDTTLSLTTLGIEDNETKTSVLSLQVSDLDEQNMNNVAIMRLLPHHPVFHPKKPEKTHVVFDCSAKYRDTSLNGQLSQGPNLTNSLVGVLTRFRKGPVALMVDIESMFLQVRVPLEDANVLRFLWWPNGDLQSEPEQYQMLIHLFGATSSPSCASFALRQTAEDNKNYFDPVTVETVQRNFYVDDCLKSVETEEEANELQEELRLLLSQGGFHLTKFMSNSMKVLESPMWQCVVVAVRLVCSVCIRYICH